MEVNSKSGHRSTQLNKFQNNLRQSEMVLPAVAKIMMDWWCPEESDAGRRAHPGAFLERSSVQLKVISRMLNITRMNLLAVSKLIFFKCQGEKSHTMINAFSLHETIHGHKNLILLSNDHDVTMLRCTVRISSLMVVWKGICTNSLYKKY